MLSEKQLVALSRQIAADAIRRGVDRQEFNRALQREFGYDKLYLIGGTQKVAHIKGFKDLYRKRRAVYHRVAPSNYEMDIKIVRNHL